MAVTSTCAHPTGTHKPAPSTCSHYLECAWRLTSACATRWLYSSVLMLGLYSVLRRDAMMEGMHACVTTFCWLAGWPAGHEKSGKGGVDPLKESARPHRTPSGPRSSPPARPSPAPPTRAHLAASLAVPPGSPAASPTADAPPRPLRTPRWPEELLVTGSPASPRAGRAGSGTGGGT
jgi:hypothetical protein